MKFIIRYRKLIVPLIGKLIRTSWAGVEGAARASPAIFDSMSARFQGDSAAAKKGNRSSRWRKEDAVVTLFYHVNWHSPLGLNSSHASPPVCLCCSESCAGQEEKSKGQGGKKTARCAKGQRKEVGGLYLEFSVFKENQTSIYLYCPLVWTRLAVSKLPCCPLTISVTADILERYMYIKFI